MTAPIALFDVKAQQALIRPELDRRIAAVLDSGRFINGPEVTEIEEKLAAFAGCAHAVGVSSGTDALQIAMMAEDIGPGDAVFLPAFTYTATAEVPLVLGATPVFVDVSAETFNIDIADLEARIAAVKKDGRLKPRAVVGVDLFGLPADWPAIEAICARDGMFALDDAAQAFGASLGNRRLGCWADAAALSFYPTKTLGAYGDGGALLTNDPRRADLFRMLRTHGEGKTRYEVERTGMNGRLDTIQAAVLLQKLAVFAAECAARQRIAERYNAALADVAIVPRLAPGNTSVWAQYTLRIPGHDRGRVLAALKADGIPTAIYYPKPLNRQTAYAQHPVAGNGVPVSERLAAEVFSLPFHPYLDEATQDRIVAATRRALGA